MLIAFEGIDGSGKGTQSKLFQDYLESEGVSAALISFPRYEETSSGQLIGRYLNGEFGDDVDPVFVSTLFALDRFQSKDCLEDLLAYNDVVICDRYVHANMAYQIARAKTEEQGKFILNHIKQLEYGIFGMPKPDAVFHLNIDVESAGQLVSKKQKRNYTDKNADRYERDLLFLQRVADVYFQLAADANSWHCINLNVDGKLLSINNIAEKVKRIYQGLIRQ